MKLLSIMFVATVALTIASPSRADVKPGPPKGSRCNVGTSHGTSSPEGDGWVCVTTGKAPERDKGAKGDKVPNKLIDKDPAKAK